MFADSSKFCLKEICDEYVTHIFRCDEMSVTGWRGQAPLQ